MRPSILCASLIACAAVFSPLSAAGEEPVGMTMPVPDVPSTVGWMIRAHERPSIPTERGVDIPSIEKPGQPPAKISTEFSRSAELTRDSGNPVHVEGDEGAFLLPVWDPGFWVLGPGGLTRRLLPAPGFINPDQTLAPDRAGCDPPT